MSDSVFFRCGSDVVEAFSMGSISIFSLTETLQSGTVELCKAAGGRIVVELTAAFALR